MDLKTTYLGLELPHPFIVGACPFSYHIDNIKRVEDAGAAAIVMHSLFEEQIIHQETGYESHIESHMESFSEATSYFPKTLSFELGPDEYLKQVAKAKETVGIPVIGSLNGVKVGTWVEYAQKIQQAGADALELNLYFIPKGDEESGVLIEERAVEVMRRVRKSVDLPIAVKLSPFFTSLPDIAQRLEGAGANALVLFNRFYQPDIDIDELEISAELNLSDSSELPLRLRWLSVLFGRRKLDLSVTGGVHTADDAIKSVMAGADSVQMVSALLRNGPGHIGKIKEDMVAWMEEKEYDSLEQMKGSMSYIHSPNPEVIERSNYMKILRSWQA